MITCFCHFPVRAKLKINEQNFSKIKTVYEENGRSTHTRPIFIIDDNIRLVLRTCFVIVSLYVPKSVDVSDCFRFILVPSIHNSWQLSLFFINNNNNYNKRFLYSAWSWSSKRFTSKYVFLTNKDLRKSAVAAHILATVNALNEEDRAPHRDHYPLFDKCVGSFKSPDKTGSTV